MVYTSEQKEQRRRKEKTKTQVLEKHAKMLSQETMDSGVVLIDGGRAMWEWAPSTWYFDAS